jgi:hypothetical protein
MAQPDDATAVYASDPDELDVTFADTYGRPAQAGDSLIVGRTRWLRTDDDRWRQDPIAGVNFAPRRR